MAKARSPKVQRGPSLADVARVKVLGSPGRGEGDASIGHPFFFPGETVVARDVVQWTLFGREEPVHVVLTTMPDSIGYKTQGRILLAYDPEATVAYGGIFFVRSYSRTCVQSIYLAEDYRRSGLGSLLADLARKSGIECVFFPVSDDGRAWARRHGFSIVRG